MDGQIFDWIMSAGGAVVGYILVNITRSINDLYVKDDQTNRRISDVELSVSTAYVRREEFTRFESAVYSKLDRIDEKIDKLRGFDRH